MKNFFCLFLVISLVSVCFAEEKNQKGKEETLALFDKCFVEVGKLLTKDDIDDFKSVSENEVENYHYTIGRLIRNNCGLLEEAKLREYFIKNSIDRPDDMSMIVLKCYYYHLKGKEFDVEKEVKKSQR
jgi:hypothetical protein